MKSGLRLMRILSTSVLCIAEIDKSTAFFDSAAWIASSTFLLDFLALCANLLYVVIDSSEFSLAPLNPRPSHQSNILQAFLTKSAGNVRSFFAYGLVFLEFCDCICRSFKWSGLK